MVLLRPFSARDAPALFEMWRDPAIARRHRLPAVTEEGAARWIEAARTLPERAQGMEWALVDNATGRLAGRRALKRIDWRSAGAEAACYVASEFRGRRFASRSLRLTAAHAFECWGIARIHADCELDNLASYRSMLRAGMTYVGVQVDHRPDPVDVHVFTLAAADLERPGSTPERRESSSWAA